jgi:hypothetical protein
MFCGFAKRSRSFWSTGDTKGTSKQVMTGIHEFKIAKCFVAKLVNILDIHCVSRLAFDDFNSNDYSPMTYSEVPKII